MDDQVAQLILDELFSSLEVLETQTAAVLQFLKEKAGSSDEQLTPYLEQAGKASSIKRRAARVRIDYLISSVTNPRKRLSSEMLRRVRNRSRRRRSPRKKHRKKTEKTSAAIREPKAKLKPRLKPRLRKRIFISENFYLAHGLTELFGAYARIKRRT
jgi:hypothetical protein